MGVSQSGDDGGAGVAILREFRAPEVGGPSDLGDPRAVDEDCVTPNTRGVPDGVGDDQSAAHKREGTGDA